MVGCRRSARIWVIGTKDQYLPDRARSKVKVTNFVLAKQTSSGAVYQLIQWVDAVGNRSLPSFLFVVTLTCRLAALRCGRDVARSLAG